MHWSQSSSADIFAGVEGKIIQILPNAEQGKMVEEGEVLLRLDNPELEVQIAHTLGEMDKTRGEIQSLNAQKAKLRATTDRKTAGGSNRG